MAAAAPTVSAQVKELREGQCLSRSIRLPIDKNTPKNMAKQLAKVRNNLNQVAARAKEDTERTYRVETVQAVTYDGSALVGTVVVTCIDEEGEDDI